MNGLHFVVNCRHAQDTPSSARCEFDRQWPIHNFVSELFTPRHGPGEIDCCFRASVISSPGLGMFEGALETCGDDDRCDDRPWMHWEI